MNEGDPDYEAPTPQIRRKKKVGARIIEYNGWASTLLIQFLESIGRDASKQLSQHEVTNIVRDYVHKNRLTAPEKKKTILCDDRLMALFGKKSISRVKIQNLLDQHFSENIDSSDEEIENGGSDEEKNCQLRSKKSSASQKKKLPELPPRSCFASVIPANIKLVYLKRSLIQEFAKVHESFEDRVLGCFVRIKCDRNDYLQKNTHQLHQVTGITFTDSEIHLKLSNYFKEVPLSQLSDDNFTEEECADVQKRVKVGELKRPLVVEVEAKATMLHVDLTKHWISREISLLQTNIDRANEKGWRREMFSYMERKQLLENPAEQEKLLSEMPKVIADPLEVEPTETPLENIEEHCLPENTFCRDTLAINSDNDHGKLATYTQHTGHLQEVQFPALMIGKESIVETAAVVHTNNTSVVVEAEKSSHSRMPASSRAVPVEPANSRAVPMEITSSRAVPTEVIELSDDDDEVMEMTNQNQVAVPVPVPIHPEDMIWLYLDPLGLVQGPFALAALKRWHEHNYFNEDFKVWSIGQTPYDALFLNDLLRHFFP